MKKISEVLVQDNGYRSLYSCDYELKNGKISNFLIYANTKVFDAVGIIARTKEGKYICIDEYRAGPEEVVRGFVLGGHEEGCSYLESAKRELSEEGGGESDEWYFLGKNIISPYMKGYMYYFFADNVEIHDQHLEESEEISIIMMSDDEITSNIESGQISCPYSIALYTLAQKYRKR